MGEINESEIALAQEGTADIWPLPKVGATVQGLDLSTGLKAIPFLVGVGPTPAADLTELTFKIPMRDDLGKIVDHHQIRTDVPSILVKAWEASVPDEMLTITAQLDQVIDRQNEALETAERLDMQKTRVGDYLAHVLEMTNRFMGDERRAVIAIPKSQISVGDMIASAVAWWDRARHQEIDE